jgi:ABC-type Na+ efflux pump permease subunit
METGKIIAVIVALVGFLVFWVLQFFWVIPHSVKGWAILVFVGIPALLAFCAAFEIISNKLSFTNKWPKVLRIFAAVVGMVIAMALMYYPFMFLREAMSQ